MHDAAAPSLDCGHFRHWDKTCATDPASCIDGPGHHDWEHCDGCGRTVCFADCPNAYAWDGGQLLCLACLDGPRVIHR